MSLQTRLLGAALAFVSTPLTQARAQQAEAPSRLGAIPALVAEADLAWLARERQNNVDPARAWTITAGSTTHDASFLCVESASSAARCWDIASASPSVVMPSAEADSLEIRLAIEPAPGRLVHLVFELASMQAEPVFAMQDILQTGNPLPPPPRVAERTAPPSVLAGLVDVELVHAGGAVVYAAHRGLVSACRVSRASWICSQAVRAASPDAVVSFEPDEQGPEFFGLELVARTLTANGYDERESVVLFRGDALEFAATLPLGGVRVARTGASRSVPAGSAASPTAGGDVDRTEVGYELWEQVGPSCLRIDAPDVERTTTRAGRERAGRAPRLGRSPDVISATAFDTQEILVDYSGMWELRADGLHRVPACAISVVSADDSARASRQAE
jgi:hypothetical protein